MTLEGLFEQKGRIITSGYKKMKLNDILNNNEYNTIRNHILLSNNINVYSMILDMPDMLYNISYEPYGEPVLQARSWG